MGGLFSKRTKSPQPIKNCEITEQDQAILKLKTQRDRIKQFMKRREACMHKERELARALLADGKKDRALLLLKKKRYQEKVFDQTLQQLQNIEHMVNELEFAQVQQQVLDGLREGNDALKKMNELFDINEIEKIMDETKEAAEYQEEISNALSGQLSQSDLADVEAELDNLLAEHADLQKIEMPDVPTDALPEAEKDRVREKAKKREPVALEA